MKLSVPENILSIKPYSPGKPIEALEREYGMENPVKLASNENPLGPSPMAVKAIRGALKSCNRYPDGSGHDLIKALSETLDVSTENIILGNGSDEIIGMLATALLSPGDEVILPQPSFLMYDIMIRSVGASPTYVPLKKLTIDLDRLQKRMTSQTHMVFVNNPNNPTGTIVSKKGFGRFLETIPPGVIVIVDEAYIEFVQDKNCAFALEYFDDDRLLVILRTFSKAYGLAGLRIGYGVMPEEITSLLNRIRPPFNTNCLAQIGARAALNDSAFLKKTIRLVHKEIDFMYDALERLGIQYFPTQTNFFLIDLKKNADEVFKLLLGQGIITRSMKSYGYPRYLRVNVGLREENIRFVKALENVLK